jgi:hypothetical protein
MDVAAKAVQLGDGYVAALFSCSGQGGLELRPTLHCVCTLTRFHFNVFVGNLETLCMRKVTKGLPLRLYA